MYNRARPSHVFQSLFRCPHAPWLCWGAEESRYVKGEEKYEMNAVVIAAEAVRLLKGVAHGECERVYFVRIGQAYLNVIQ